MTAYSARKGRYNMSQVATWATAAPTNGSTWVNIPALDAPAPKREQGTDAAQESDNDGMSSLDYATVKGGSLSFSTRCLTGTLGFDGAGGDNAPTTTFLKNAFSSYFGAAANAGADFAGTTTSTSGSGATVNLTSVANLTVGMACMVSTDVRFVKSIATNAVTLNYAPTSVLGSQAVYGAYNWKPTLGEKAEYDYINAEMGTEDVLLGPGRFTGLKLQNLAGKDGARLAFDFSADTFATGVTPTSVTYANATYTGAQIVGKGGLVALDGTEIHISEASVDFGVKHEEIVDPSGTNGRAGYAIVSCDPVVEFSQYYSSTQWTSWTGRSRVDVMLSFPGNTTSAATRARTTYAVWMPAAQITVEDAVINGQRAQKVKCVGKRPTSADKTAGILCPIYFAILGGV